MIRNLARTHVDQPHQLPATATSRTNRREQEGPALQPLLPNDPDHVGNYRLLRRLGTGAMGSVYLGQSRSGRLLAIKVVRTDLAVDDEFRERFRRSLEVET